MKKTVITLAIAVIACLAASCVHDNFDSAMLDDNTPRLVVGGKAVHTYSAVDGQLAYSPSSREFRVSNDTMSEYFVVDCADMPSSQGQKIKCSVCWTAKGGTQKRTGVTFKVENIADDTVWLWSSSESMGAVVKILR